MRSNHVFWRALLGGLFLLVFADAAMAASTLEVLTLGSPGKEFEQWGTTFAVSAPQDFTMRWSTTAAGAAGGDWVVTDASSATVAKGSLTQASASGVKAMFSIASFLPPSAAASTKYYIRITPHDAANKPTGTTSPPVTITYEPPSPPIHFDADLGASTTTAAIEAGHPSIRFIRYDPLTQTTTGKLTLQVYNDGAKATDPVDVRITDGHLVVRQDGGPIHVNALASKAHKFITFTLKPQLTVGKPTVEQNWDAWRARFPTGFRILAGSSKTGSAYVQWQQPQIAGRAGFIVCGWAPASATDAGAKIRDCVEDRMRAILADTNGTKGFLLKRVSGGTVLASQNAGTVFEPASAIKVIINFAAFKKMAANPAATKLTTQISWFKDFEKDGNGKDTSCPKDSNKATETLQSALTAMMQQSDNRRTQALRVFLGQDFINNTAHSAAGMSDTLYQHRDGCGSDAVAHPNRLTLNDASKLYAGVVTNSLLSATAVPNFFSVMAGGSNPGGMLKTIASQEAPDGMPASKVASFVAAMTDRFKPGRYGLSTGEYATIAGVTTIPFKSGSTTTPTNFTYGAFVVKASNADTVTDAYTVSNEILREQIHEALLRW